jgi:serine/threonine-protein kinase HipA
MSGRVAAVFLGDVRVGTLVEDDDSNVEFRIAQRYHELRFRPVIGQWFEDHPHRTQAGPRPGELPAFFANLIPEGDLRLRLEERLGVAPADDFGFLCAVGGDLPGAITVLLEDGETPAVVPTRPVAETVDAGLRFSLAGVQLKFSMIRQGDRFALPGRDDRGEWIAKIALDPYTDLCANERVTMEWARQAGFEVPATELRPLQDLVGVPFEGDPAAHVFLVRRYDRLDGGGRLHQEDFQQIVGRPPEGKYDDVTCEGLTLLATRIAGEEAYGEMLRRIAFAIASGNNDAHMKNWSVVYPDGIRARLSPLYDQVFTAQWPSFAIRMALKLGGTKEFAAMDARRFRELARRLGRSPEEAEAIAVQTVAEAATAWRQVRDQEAATAAYRDALRQHWARVPLLQPHASSI